MTTLKILVVDDNVDSAESLALLLSMNGHQTQVAHDGLEALALAETFRPDVMLLDLGLPKLDGLGVCRQLRRTDWGRAVSIVALTGFGQDSDRLEVERAGFDRHLLKPIDYDQLLGTLGTLLLPRS